MWRLVCEVRQTICFVVPARLRLPDTPSPAATAVTDTPGSNLHDRRQRWSATPNFMSTANVPSIARTPASC